MIVSAPDMSRSRDRFGLRGPMPAVWGLNVPELHDRFWSSSICMKRPENCRVDAGAFSAP